MKKKILAFVIVIVGFLSVAYGFTKADSVAAQDTETYKPCNNKSENWSTPVCPTIPEDTTPETTAPEETVPEDTTPEESYPLDTVAPTTTPAPTTTACMVGDRPCSDIPTTTVCTLGDRLCSELTTTTVFTGATNPCGDRGCPTTTTTTIDIPATGCLDGNLCFTTTNPPQSTTTVTWDSSSTHTLPVTGAGTLITVLASVFLAIGITLMALRRVGK